MTTGLVPPGVPGAAGAPREPGTPGEPLLAARDIAVWFPVGSQLGARLRHEERLLRAVDGVDLEIKRGVHAGAGAGRAASA